MPSSKNVWDQKVARRRRREAGNLTDVRKQFFYWLRIIDDGVEAAVSENAPELAIKWLHCAAQIAGNYLKIIETEDFHDRLKKIEDDMGVNDKRKG